MNSDSPEQKALEDAAMKSIQSSALVDALLTIQQQNGNPPMGLRMGTSHPYRDRFENALAHGLAFAMIQQNFLNDPQSGPEDVSELLRDLITGTLGYRTETGLSELVENNPQPEPPVFEIGVEVLERTKAFRRESHLFDKQQVQGDCLLVQCVEMLRSLQNKETLAKTDRNQIGDLIEKIDHCLDE